MVLRVVNYVLMFMIAGVYALAVYASKNETELFHIIGVGNFALFAQLFFCWPGKRFTTSGQRIPYRWWFTMQ